MNTYMYIVYSTQFIYDTFDKKNKLYFLGHEHVVR